MAKKVEWFKIESATMNKGNAEAFERIRKAQKALSEAQNDFIVGFTARIEKHIPKGHTVIYSFKYGQPAFAFVERDNKPGKSNGLPFDLD